MPVIKPDHGPRLGESEASRRARIERDKATADRKKLTAELQDKAKPDVVKIIEVLERRVADARTKGEKKVSIEPIDLLVPIELSSLSILSSFSSEADMRLLVQVLKGVFTRLRALGYTRGSISYSTYLYNDHLDGYFYSLHSDGPGWRRFKLDEKFPFTATTTYTKLPRYLMSIELDID